MLKLSAPPIVKTAITSISVGRDAYISAEDKSENFGNITTWRIQATDLIGTGLDRYFWAFFYFDYKNFSHVIEEAIIQLVPQEGSPLLETSAHLVSGDWDEYNITYNNQPDIIEYGIFAGSHGLNNINVTDYIYDRTNISIRAHASFVEGQSRYAWGFSREKVHTCDTCRPRLLLSYSALFDVIITNPTNHTILRNGDFLPIRWITIGPIENVKIELFKDDNFISTINSSTENDGFYNWTVGYPEAYEGQNYSIKVSDVLNSDVFEYSHSFTIQGSVPFDPSIFIISGSIIGVVSVITIITLIVRKRSRKT